MSRGDHLGLDLGLRDDDRLGAARDARHQRQVAAVAPHHLDQERALVRRGRDLQAVDRLERDVQRGVDADRDLGARQIVVDRRRDADDLEAHLRQRQRPGLRAVAADDDQAVDAARRAGCARPRARTASSLNSRSRALPRNVPPRPRMPPTSRAPERLDRALDQAGVAVAHAEDLPALVDAVRTTARMAAFIPGASPPLVSTAIFLVRHAREGIAIA